MNVLLLRNGDQQKFLYLDGKGIDEHLGVVSKKGTRVFKRDHLGTVLNSEMSYGIPLNGNFGEPIDDRVNVKAWDVPVLYGYTGRQFDPESGLYYYRARMYDPKIGRFITRDPLGFKGGAEQPLYLCRE